MTRAKKSSLVLDGNEVKLRLEAERTAAGTPVHVDWVRFTCLLRNAPFVSVDSLFPAPLTTSVWDEDYRKALMAKVLQSIPREEFMPSHQALELAREAAEMLGPDFAVAPEVRKGHDFYRFRWSIEREGKEVGWVGYLASSDSPRQQSQAKTLHVNLYGAACTFAAHGWNHRIADLIDARKADLTRADLALDFFDGLPGGMDWVAEQYKSGACDVGGRRLKSRCVGDWMNGRERSLYIGSKQAGKETNLYEKGHQLFGDTVESDWLRAELRYGNKLRVLPSDILRRPADFFAGASEWHATLLRIADAQVKPETVTCNARLPLETVEAEAARNIGWALRTAAPTIAACFQYLGEDDFLELVTAKKLPGRLRSFKPSEVVRAFSTAFQRVTTAERTGPAFA